MKGPSEIVFQSSGPAKLIDGVRALTPILERQEHFELLGVVMNYIQAYEWEGTYDLLNGQPVATMLKDAKADGGPNVVEEGEVEGVRYTLYEARDTELRREDE